MATKKTVEEWEEKFREFDANGEGQGVMSIYEFRDLMQAEGSKMSGQQLCEMYVEYFSSSGENITLDQFKAGMAKVHAEKERLTTEFNEWNTDGDEFLEKEDMKVFAKKCGLKVSDEDLEGILGGIDSTGDGKVSLQEFLDYFL